MKRVTNDLDTNDLDDGLAADLSEGLGMAEWQKRRDAQRRGLASPAAAPAILTDDLQPGGWQAVRNRQAAGDTLVAGAADDSIVGGAGRDRLAAPTQPGIPGYDVDLAFLAGREGSRRDIYVPEDKAKRALGHSGPTIGKGVDLGGKDVAYLKGLGLNPGLVAKLTPYLGRRGEAAQTYVREHRLVLSGPEQAELDAAVQRRELDKLAAKFDAASQVGAFRQLPRKAQTAFASLYFQYGTDDPAGATPNYWRQITSGDWDGAYRNLQAFGDAYAPRRRLEAELLRDDIRSGKLPGSRAPGR